MIKILALGPQAIWPPTDGGKEGIFGAITALSRNCRVTYVCPCEAPDPESFRAFSKAGIEYKPASYQPRDSIANIVTATLKAIPFKFYKYSNPTAIKAFAKVVSDMQPDCLVCHHAHMGSVGLALRKMFKWQTPIILREHNIEYQIVESYRRTQPFLIRYPLIAFQLITRHYERLLWQQVDAVAFLSDADYKCGMESGIVKRGFLAREGVPIPRRRNLDKCHQLKTVFYPFNPKASQNRFNLREFINKYWVPARLNMEIDDLKLLISGIGTNECSEITGLSPEQQYRAGIESAGFIDKLESVYASSLAVVSSTFVGGGVRKKILEAMANEVPVIATDLDLKTSNYYRESVNILKFEDAHSFSKCLNLLKNDGREWLRIASAGRKTVESYADWSLYSESLLNEVLSLTRIKG